MLHDGPDSSPEGALQGFRRGRKEVLLVRLRAQQEAAVLRRLAQRHGSFPGGLRSERHEGRVLLRLQGDRPARSEEHTSELQSLMRISYAVFCLKKKNRHPHNTHHTNSNPINIRWTPTQRRPTK